MAHTQGPWYVEERNPGEYDITTGENGQDLAFLLDGINTNPEANAWLIAAAPDLLEALEGLVKAIDLSHLNIREHFSLLNYHAASLKAIAKAKGR